MMAMVRIAMGAVGRLGRTAVGMMGIVLAVAVIMPSPATGPRSGPGDPEGRENVVAVVVPDGELSKTLTITDASGRELATLTHYRADFTHFTARCEGGPEVSCALYPQTKSITIDLAGDRRQTHIRVNRDGATTGLVMPAIHQSRAPAAHDDLPEEGAGFPTLLPFFSAQFAF